MRFRHWQYVYVLAALLVWVAGCTALSPATPVDPDSSMPSDQDTSPEMNQSQDQSTVPPLYLHNFLERWVLATGDPGQLWKFEVSDGRTDNPFLGLEAVIRPEPMDESRLIFVVGTATKAVGRIIELEVRRANVGDPFTEEHRELMRPIYDALVGVMEPNLSTQERREILAALLLVDTSPEDLKRRLKDGERPSLIRPGIEYHVKWSGSGEGSTVALKAVVTERE